jgi:hypothetical protein
LPAIGSRISLVPPALPMPTLPTCKALLHHTHVLPGCAHVCRLSTRLGRDIVLGGTSVETPAKFLRHVLDLSTPDHAALEVEGPASRFKF